MLFTKLVVAFAAGQPYTQSQFDTLMKVDKSAILHVHAPWCQTCKIEDLIIDAEMKSQAYKGVTILEVDFDIQKDAFVSFNVSTKSTTIVFKQDKGV